MLLSPPLQADGNPVLLLIQELTCHQDFIRISQAKVLEPKLT